MMINTKRATLCTAVFILFLSYCNSLFAAEDDLYQRSMNLELAGQYVRAAQALEPLLDKSGDKTFAQMRSGWLYYLAEDYSRSVKFYETALKQNQHSLETRLGLMLPLMAQKRWREAAQQANAVIAVSKWNYYAHVRLMICEESLGLWQDLIDHAKQVQLRYPADATVLVYLARAYANKNSIDDARKAYQMVLNRVPGHVEASEYIGSHWSGLKG